MRFFLIFLCVLFQSLSLKTYAQKSDSTKSSELNIVGIWQLHTNEISSALHETFQFFKNGKFVYNLSNYDDLNPLSSISGTYILEKNLLKLKIMQIKLRVRFKIAEADHGFQSGPFQLIEGKFITIQQNDLDYSEHEFELVKELKKTLKVAVKIDEDLYFKLSDDPNKFTQ